MAELGLAFVGLAGQLFTSIVASYGFLSTAKGLETDAPMLLWKLRIQEIRLRVWGRHWGIDEGKFDLFLEQEGLYDDVVGILKQLRAVLDDAENLKNRYGIQQQSQPESSDKDVANAISAITSPSGQGTKVEATVKRQKPAWSSKLRWALTDKNKLESLINDLKDFNDGLHGVLRLRETVSLNRVIQSEVLHVTEKIEDIRLVQVACRRSLPLDPSKSHGTNVLRSTQIYNDLQLSARSKEMFIQLQEQSLPPLGTSLPFIPRSSVHKSRSCIKIIPENSPSSARIFGQYLPEVSSPGGTSSGVSVTVLVEWKDYDPDGPYQFLISQRVDNLARLLSKENPKPSDFRVLECLAYIEDNHLPRFGFLYELPSGSVNSPPATLLDLLARGHNIQVPDLGERFALAQALAISIMRLHDCGWIHGAIRSSNVIFFHRGHTTTSSAAIPLREPYILGFNYSRPSDPSEVTLDFSKSNLVNDLYRHPEVACHLVSSNPQTCQHKGYRMCHDLYSLGIMLLEIGLWEQIRAVWKDHYTHERFVCKLLDSYVPKLGPKMGAIYRDVVRALLKMEVHEWEGEASSGESSGQESEGPSYKHRNPMYWLIVKELERCCA